MESALPRRTLSWSLERSRIQADRDATVSLSFVWKQDGSGTVHYFGYESSTGRLKGSVALLGSDFVARAVAEGSGDIVRVGAFPISSGCVALRQAQAAVEAHFASPAASVSEAA